MPEKKRFFKKEKKELKLKRHKAPSGTKAVVKIKTEKIKVAIEPIQNEAKISQFPNISRVITEPFDRIRASLFGKFKTSVSKNSTKLAEKENFVYTRNFWLTIILVLCIGFGIYLSWQLWIVYAKWHQATTQYAKLEQQLATWEKIIKEYPTYRDAYFEAAVLAYRLGEKGKEQQYIQQTLAIDPNFQPAQELEKISK